MNIYQKIESIVYITFGFYAIYLFGYCCIPIFISFADYNKDVYTILNNTSFALIIGFIVLPILIVIYIIIFITLIWEIKKWCNYTESHGSMSFKW